MTAPLLELASTQKAMSASRSKLNAIPAFMRSPDHPVLDESQPAYSLFWLRRHGYE